MLSEKIGMKLAMMYRYDQIMKHMADLGASFSFKDRIFWGMVYRPYSREVFSFLGDEVPPEFFCQSFGVNFGLKIVDQVRLDYQYEMAVPISEPFLKSWYGSHELMLTVVIGRKRQEATKRAVKFN